MPLEENALRIKDNIQMLTKIYGDMEWQTITRIWKRQKSGQGTIRKLKLKIEKVIAKNVKIHPKKSFNTPTQNVNQVQDR